MFKNMHAIIKKITQLFNEVLERNYGAENCFVTCSGKKDGVGAQVQAILSTMLFAQKFRLTYVHTPFDSIQHNELGEDWETRWESFFNLSKDEITINELKSRALKVVHVTDPEKIKRRPNRLYIIKHCHRFADAHPNCYSSVINRFIEKYQSSSKEVFRTFYETGKINIAVHVRRGDVSQKQRGAIRYTDSLYYKFLLQKTLSVLSDLNLDARVHLYSQGAISDFHELKEINIDYHLNECPFTTFYNLTTADILIMAKSSFSYSAALLSKAIKIYEPFWHKPLNDWIVADWNDKTKKVVFDESKLKQTVHNLSI